MSFPFAPSKRASKAQEKARALRESIWPGFDEKLLWSSTTCKGYTPVPRTLPLIMNIIDVLTKNKPAGRPYFVLWCRSFDQSLISIDNPLTLAIESGFSGERALSTWRDRMRSLVELGFILAKDGPAGPYQFVLMLNPHKVVWNMRDQIQEGMFRQLQARAIDIGAEDLGPVETEAESAVAAEPSTADAETDGSETDEATE